MPMLESSNHLSLAKAVTVVGLYSATVGQMVGNCNLVSLGKGLHPPGLVVMVRGPIGAGAWQPHFCQSSPGQSVNELVND